jgi:hypothetical protein
MTGRTPTILEIGCMSRRRKKCECVAELAKLWRLAEDPIDIGRDISLGH